MATSKEMVLITGNTYPVREQLKALGGRWDSARYGWLVPAAQAERAREIVAKAGPLPTTQGTSSGPVRRRSSRPWYPCGYPGCNRNYCDECDGMGGGSS